MDKEKLTKWVATQNELLRLANKKAEIYKNDSEEWHKLATELKNALEEAHNFIKETMNKNSDEIK